MSKTIMLKGDGIFKEANAGGAITPGHLIDRNSAGAVVVHATAAGNVAVPMFALEQDTVGNDIDTAYASGDRVQMVVPQPGSEVYALLPASAAAVVIGDLLESSGDGTLRKYTAPSQAVNEGGSATYTIAPKVNAIVARALEAVDNSGGGTAVRIKVEVV